MKDLRVAFFVAKYLCLFFLFFYVSFIIYFCDGFLHHTYISWIKDKQYMSLSPAFVKEATGVYILVRKHYLFPPLWKW